MEYTINDLASLSGISTRTLRYYDEIDLLKPKRISNNYRIYSQFEIDKLQQILFYKEIGLPLDDIKKIINNPSFDYNKALNEHLITLNNKKNQLETLIENVTKTIDSLNGGIKMSNKDKFNGFKENLIKENEEKYGKEIRSKYGEKTINDSNKKMMNLSEEKYNLMIETEKKMNELFVIAMNLNDPSSLEAQEACKLHKEWLMIAWPDGYYAKEKHLGLCQMYVDDERFTKYYDKVKPGLAVFLNEAMKIYLK